jgi:hypothetical protein
MCMNISALSRAACVYLFWARFGSRAIDWDYTVLGGLQIRAYAESMTSRQSFEVTLLNLSKEWEGTF